MDRQSTLEVIDQTFSYLVEVKETFKDEKEKYKMFRDILADYDAERTDHPGMVAQLRELFKGHDYLIRFFYFDLWLLKKVVYYRGFQFAERVKERLGNVDEHDKFLKFVQDYPTYIIADKHELRLLVNGIFGEHVDLVDEFYQFLRFRNFATRSGLESG